MPVHLVDLPDLVKQFAVAACALGLGATKPVVVAVSRN